MNVGNANADEMVEQKMKFENRSDRFKNEKVTVKKMKMGVTDL